MSICAFLKASLLMTLFIIILSTFVVSSEARFAQNAFAATPNNRIDGHLFLRKFRYDRSKLEFYRRKLVLDQARPERTSPGGPDPQHH
ncbi:hypothetical protein L484_018690 [Morus notabilis]|uniref:CLAVATA3/ESR (CLE)-related protein 5 n=1 Tax=Morus notabilis TaxID=981085 RepID=W9RZA7_9ROSA|nr:hypothetical protein L484_018690 [Morus notabilis]